MSLSFGRAIGEVGSIGWHAPLLDLLEYQGKQLFAQHGVPVPKGKHARTIEDAVAAAEEIGYPCVVKAQVQIGGRGKAGGIKVAENRDEAEQHARAILGMQITGPHGEGPFEVHELWIEEASKIDAEYYASIILDRSAKKLLTMLSTMGGMNVEEIAEKDPDALVKRHVEPDEGFGPEQAAASWSRRPASTRTLARQDRGDDGEALRRLRRARRDPDRGQPAGRHLRPRGRRARLQDDDRQLGAVSATRTSPPSRTSRRWTRRSGWRRRRASPTSSSTATSASSPTAPGSACPRWTWSPRPAATRPTSSTRAAAPRPTRSSPRWR